MEYDDGYGGISPQWMRVLYVPVIVGAGFASVYLHWGWSILALFLILDAPLHWELRLGAFGSAALLIVGVVHPFLPVHVLLLIVSVLLPLSWWGVVIQIVATITFGVLIAPWGLGTLLFLVLFYTMIIAIRHMLKILSIRGEN